MVTGVATAPSPRGIDKELHDVPRRFEQGRDRTQAGAVRGWRPETVDACSAPAVAALTGADNRKLGGTDEKHPFDDSIEIVAVRYRRDRPIVADPLQFTTDRDAMTIGRVVDHRARVDFETERFQIDREELRVVLTAVLEPQPRRAYFEPRCWHGQIVVNNGDHPVTQPGDKPEATHPAGRVHQNFGDQPQRARTVHRFEIPPLLGAEPAPLVEPVGADVDVIDHGCTLAHRHYGHLVAVIFSRRWFDELDAALGASNAVPRDVSIRLGYRIVTDTEPIEYTIVADRGTARVDLGIGAAVDVVFEQSWVTAVELASGQTSAHEAFMTGSLAVNGDTKKLVGVDTGWLEAAQATLRERTDYRAVSGAGDEDDSVG